MRVIIKQRKQTQNKPCDLESRHAGVNDAYANDKHVSFLN